MPRVAADAAGPRTNIQSVISDSTLVAPRDGRVQFRAAQPGEVAAGGGKVINLVDLGDVYMSFFCRPSRPDASPSAPRFASRRRTAAHHSGDRLLRRQRRAVHP